MSGRTKRANPKVVSIAARAQAGGRAPRADHESARSPVRALVDGQELVLEGYKRIELRCGKASLILTEEGKVLVNGTYISSTSSGAHRIRGGSVDIN